MSSGTPSTEPQSSGSSAGMSTSPTSMPAGKGTTTPPKVTQQDVSVELKNMRPDRSPPKGSIPLGEDIMQIARIGEIGPMQRLFDEKKFTANYQDEEGITPLHVSANSPFLLNSVGHYTRTCTNGFVWDHSGPRSIINTPCASSCWTMVPTLTPKVVIL
jgi:hypothetical protein